MNESTVDLGSENDPIGGHTSAASADGLLPSPNEKSMSSIEQYHCLLSRRQRSEKRPIPEEQKDEKYFERRKRNNEAAKKSRDARKMREDRVRAPTPPAEFDLSFPFPLGLAQIAFRAAFLERENAILRAQILALRDEVTALQQLICNRPLA